MRKDADEGRSIGDVKFNAFSRHFMTKLIRWFNEIILSKIRDFEAFMLEDLKH